MRRCSTAKRMVRVLIPKNRAASVSVSQSCAAAVFEQTGMLFLQRREVTRPRVQRFPRPVRKPLRLSTPAMAESSQMRAKLRTAATMAFAVAVQQTPRRRRGKRSSVCTPPCQ